MPGGGSGELDLAFVDTVPGGDVEGVPVEAAIVDAAIMEVRAREDELDPTGLVEDLEACFGADEEVSIGGDALTIEGADFAGGGSLGVEVGLLVGGLTAADDAEGVGEWAIEVADDELGLVGAEADAVGAFEGVDFEVPTVRVEMVDEIFSRVGIVDLICVGDDDVVAPGVF